MKRLGVAVIALSMTVLTVNAQKFIGGGLGFSFDDGKTSLGKSENLISNVGFSFSPQVGYHLNDDFSIGISGSIGKYKSEEKRIDPYISTNKIFSNSWSINVFGRYKLLGLGIENLSLLIEGSIYIKESNLKEIENTVNQHIENRVYSPTTFGINSSPVLSYKLSERIDVLAYFNFLSFGCGYYNQTISDTNYKMSGYSFNLGFNSFSDLMTIGFLYNF